MNPLIAFSLLLAGFLGGTIGAQTFETEILASTGGVVGGDSSLRFAEIGRAVINLDGDTCFKGRVLQDGVSKMAIIRIVDGQSEVIALSGDPVTPWRDEAAFVTNAKFADFGNPAMNDDQRVAFLTKFEILGAQIILTNQHGIVLTGESAGEHWVLDRVGREAKVAGEARAEQSTNGSRQLRLGDPAFDGQGGIYYPSVVQKSGEGGFEYRNMIYEIPIPASPASTLSQPDFIFRGEEYLPSSGGSAAALPGPIAAVVDSNRDFRAIVQTAAGRRLLHWSGGQETTLLAEGDPLPGSAGHFVTNLQGSPDHLGEIPTYLAKATDSNSTKEAILQGVNSPEVLVTSGQAIAGYEDAGVVVDLSEPVATPNGSIAFVATLQTGGEELRTSVWRKLAAGVEPRPLAIEGQQVPGAAPGVTYRFFGTPIINVIGQVVFPAILNHGYGINSQNDFAYFVAEPNRAVRRVIAEGDFFFFGWLDLQRIQSLELSAMNEEGQMALTLGAEDGRSALIKVGIPPSSLPNYDDWALANFPDSSQRGRHLDPDGDGVLNFLEYAYGTDPTDPESSSLPEMIFLEFEDERTLAMEFNRFRSETDVHYVVEFSSDLVVWESGNQISGEIQGDMTSSVRGVVQVFDKNTSGSKRRFARVRAFD